MILLPNAINIFDKNGKQIALSAAKLSKNSILKFGEGKAATICRTDQLGGIYRAGDELIANNTYVLNGYKYSTDSTGRIIEAVADKLELKDHQGRKLILESAKLIGRGFEKATDDRGALICGFIWWGQYSWKYCVNGFKFKIDQAI